MAVATGTALLIGGLAAGAGTAYGAKKSASASRDATAASARASDQAIALERERDAEARRQWEADQARRAPFREAADAMLRARAAHFGMQLEPRQAPSYPGPAPAQAAPQPSTLGQLARRPPTPMAQPSTYQPMTPALQAPRSPRTLGDLARRRY